MLTNQYKAIYKGDLMPTLNYGGQYNITVGISSAGYTVKVEGNAYPLVYKSLREYSNDWSVLAKENEPKAPVIVPTISRQVFNDRFPFVRPTKATTEQKEAIRVAFTTAWERDDLIHVTDTISKAELRDALGTAEFFNMSAGQIIKRLTDQFLSDND